MMARNHLIEHLQVLQILRRNGAMGNGIPELLQSSTSSTTSLSIVQAGIFPHFLD